MFSKRHYEAIATVCQEYRKHSANFQTKAVRDNYQWEFEGRLSDMFERTSPGFKREWFLRACQPGANVKARG